MILPGKGRLSRTGGGGGGGGGSEVEAGAGTELVDGLTAAAAEDEVAAAELDGTALGEALEVEAEAREVVAVPVQAVSKKISPATVRSPKRPGTATGFFLKDMGSWIEFKRFSCPN